jgi:NAD(P)-dependent dehydrogenase (short-subunit alcohol dehydrogenase family)
MGRLDGKIVMITGAAQGLGQTQAELCAEEGAIVIATDLKTDLLEEVIKGINDSGKEAIGIKQDVSSEEDWKNVMYTAIDTYGRLDVLVNNAGISLFLSLTDTSLDIWNQVMNINATGTFLGMKHAIPEMQKSGGGSIVNISSVTGITGDGFAAYNTSKGAIRSLTKNAAVSYAHDKIRVNSVHPGMMVTPLTQPILDTEEGRKEFESKTLLPYLGSPIDVAYGVLYLASDESKFVTGTELIIDGGLLAK